MKILFLLTQDIDSPSGLGRYFPIAKELVKLGHEASIVALHPDFKYLKRRRFVKNGVEILYVSQMHVQKSRGEKTYYSLLKLIKIIFQATIRLIQAAIVEPADIIIIGKPHPMNSIAALFGKVIRQCTIYLDCDDYEIGINRIEKEWQGWILEKFDHWVPHIADVIITNTNFNYSRIRKMTSQKTKIVYLPNGVDLERFKIPEAIETRRLIEDFNLENKLIISYIGTLGLTSHPIDLLLKAFKIVTIGKPNAMLLMVGGGEDLSTIEQITKNLGISNSVIFCGRVPSETIPAYYAISNVTVDPVLDNPIARGRSPLKIFESLCLGIPVVTGNVGDRNIYLEEGRFGILVKPGDEHALAEGILNILNNPQKQKEISLQAIKQRDKWSWSHLVRNIKTLFL